MSIESGSHYEAVQASLDTLPNTSNVVRGRFSSPPPDQPPRTLIDSTKIPAGIFSNTSYASAFLELLSPKQEYFLLDEPIPENVEFISLEALEDHYRNNDIRVEVYLHPDRIVPPVNPEPPTAA